MIQRCERQVMETGEWAALLDDVGALEPLLRARDVAIKPNLAAGTYVDPASHVISSLELLGSLVRFVHAANPDAQIRICESDSTGYGYAFAKFEHLRLPESLGLDEATRSRVEMLDLSRDRLVRVQDPRFMRFSDDVRQLWLSEALVRSDYRVSLGNLKTHSVTGFSGACKNLFGCLPDSDKSVHHPFIHETVHDVTLALMPQLNIVDGFYGMERNGPVQGRPVDSGFMIVSDSPIEADIRAVEYAGLRLRDVRHLQYLSRRQALRLGEDRVVSRAYRRPTAFIRSMNVVGLLIQRSGHRVERFGHRIHAVGNLATLVATLFRPILLRVVSIETLRRWNRKINAS